MSKNDQNVTGIRLVIDRDTEEFWLFKEDDTPGLIHGKYGHSSFDYTESTSQFNGVFSGSLEVQGIPFEIAKYDAAKVEEMLRALPREIPDTQNNQSDKEGTVMSDTKKYEHFNPDTDASRDTPPAGMSRKHKKKWFKERKQWLSEHPDTTKVVAPKLEETKELDPKPVPKLEEQEKLNEAKEELKDTADKTKKTEKVKEAKDDKVKVDIKTLGAGNKIGIIGDVAEGYFIGRFFSNSTQYAILQVPDSISAPLKQSLFLVFPKKATAEHMVEKLSANPDFQVIIEGTEVYPITSLKTSEWELGAAIIHNVASFLQTI